MDLWSVSLTPCNQNLSITPSSMSLKCRLSFLNWNRLEFKDLPISHVTQTKALNSASLNLLSPTLSAFYSPKGMKANPEC